MGTISSSIQIRRSARGGCLFLYTVQLQKFLSQMSSETKISPKICKSMKNIFKEYFVNFSEFAWRDHIDDDVDWVHPTVPGVEYHWLKKCESQIQSFPIAFLYGTVSQKLPKISPWKASSPVFCRTYGQKLEAQWRLRRQSRDATLSHACKSGNVVLLNSYLLF